VESLARGELAHGFDKAKFCFVKSADFHLGKNEDPRNHRRNTLSNPCADLTTLTPRAKDSTNAFSLHVPSLFWNPEGFQDGGWRFIAMEHVSTISCSSRVMQNGVKEFLRPL
jgi:hypothetical protein